MQYSKLSKYSKWFHKYFGLVLILFIAWMSFSGVLLNHPDLISGVNIPAFLTPNQYHYKSWNRSSLIELQYLKQNPETAIGCGKAGVWITYDGGNTFTSYNEGLPESLYYLKTADLFVFEDGNTLFLAGTKGGLYKRYLDDSKWVSVDLPLPDADIKKILHINDRLVLFSDSDVFSSAFPAEKFHFEKVTASQESESEYVSLVDLFFELHSGSIWGFPGKLLFDLAGIILFFLSVSAFYSWYYPWKRKKQKPFGIQSSGRVRRMFKWFFKYHLKLGIWAALVLLIFGVTGFFMRPPMLVALTNGRISKVLYPGHLDENPWHGKINNALYNKSKNQIVIETTDGFWQGKADFSEPFHKYKMNVPVFVMGTTVFENIDSVTCLVGSYNGLFRYNSKTDISYDLLTQREADNISSVMPADIMITGYFITPDDEVFITSHEKGLLPVDNAQTNGRFQMPEEASQIGFPMWNWLFEIHNGRFFKDWIGGFYILIIPLGSLLYVLIILSGVYDWFYIKFLKKRESNEKRKKIKFDNHIKKTGKTKVETN